MSADLYGALQRQSQELDALMGRVAAGVRSQGEYDALEERAAEIGRAIRDAFRRKPG